MADVTLCSKCGRPLFHARTLMGSAIKGGRYEVWVHVDTGWSACSANGEENGLVSSFGDVQHRKD